MFCAHWSCDALFVMNELHDLHFIGYERIVWKKKKTENKIKKKTIAFDSMCGTIIL